MSRETRTIGSLLLLGAVLLSLNALAVSARPGAIAPAEIVTAPPVLPTDGGTGVPETDGGPNMGPLPTEPVLAAFPGAVVTGPGLAPDPAANPTVTVRILGPTAEESPPVPIAGGIAIFPPTQTVDPYPPTIPTPPGGSAPVKVPPASIEPVYEGL